MILHPSIHFEIARQRQQDLLADAKRTERLVGLREASNVRPQRPASASRSAFKAARHSDVEVGLEV